jgi:hypothetical protein
MDATWDLLETYRREDKHIFAGAQGALVARSAAWPAQFKTTWRRLIQNDMAKVDRGLGTGKRLAFTGISLGQSMPKKCKIAPHSSSADPDQSDLPPPVPSPLKRPWVPPKLICESRVPSTDHHKLFDIPNETTFSSKAGPSS